MTYPKLKVDLIMSAILAVICAYHIAHVTYGNLYPSVPEIILMDKTMKEIEFPVAFLSCLNEILEEDSPSMYTKYGYETVNDYYSGRKKRARAGLKIKVRVLKKKLDLAFENDKLKNSEKN